MHTHTHAHTHTHTWIWLSSSRLLLLTSAPGARWNPSEEALPTLSGLLIGWGRDLVKGGEYEEEDTDVGTAVQDDAEEEDGEKSEPFRKVLLCWKLEYWRGAGLDSCCCWAYWDIRPSTTPTPPLLPPATPLPPPPLSNRPAVDWYTQTNKNNNNVNTPFTTGIVLTG